MRLEGADGRDELVHPTVIGALMRLGGGGRISSLLQTRNNKTKIIATVNATFVVGGVMSLGEGSMGGRLAYPKTTRNGIARIKHLHGADQARHFLLLWSALQ